MDAKPVAFPTDLLCAWARTHFSVEVMEVKPIGVSENYAFALTGRNGHRWFCRIHTGDPVYDERLPGEFLLLDHLSDVEPGLAPRGVRTCDGACRAAIVCEHRSYWMMMFSWREGAHRAFDQVTTADMAAMGEATARFHRAAARWPLRPSRPVYDVACYGGPDTFYHRQEFHALVAEQDRQPFLDVRHRLQAYAASPRASELRPIHFDLHLGNFLFDGDAAVMIDFDECGYGYPLFDLGHILFALQGRPDHADLADALVERYEATVGVSIERADLRLFQCVQAVAIVRYFLRLYDRTAGATNLFPHVPGIARSVSALLRDP